jgi:molybdenum cofactor cytidylyltransferase
MDAFKPLLKYNGQPFVSSILQKLYPVCDKVGIVTGYKNKEVEETVNKIIIKSNFDKDKINLIYNSEYEKGMFNSLQTGLKDLSDCEWLLYHFVDQPHLPAQFYSDFINQIEDTYNWIQPAFGNKKGHPILLHYSLFPKILDSNSTSLKNLSHLLEIKKKIWNCNYPQIVEDIDTKDDYQKLT